MTLTSPNLAGKESDLRMDEMGSAGDHISMHELEPSCIDRLAYSIPNFATSVDLSVDTIRKPIDSGDLIPSLATRAGRKPIITGEEGLRWLRSLPQR